MSRIPDDEWATVVRNVPILSVDLVVRREGRVALGKRHNEPAKGEWFVPGGRVAKGERLIDAVHRVAEAELGLDVEIVRRLGVYEHFYDVADVDGADGKHYVPVGFLVTAGAGTARPDDQHETFEWFEPPFEGLDLHPYVRAYLADAGLVGE